MRAHVTALCFGLTLFAHCAAAQTATEDESDAVTEKRLEVLESLWDNLNRIYPALEYKGIGGREWLEPAENRIRRARSDAEFYDVLLEQMARLNDTHTRIVSYPGQPKLAPPPLQLNQVQGKVAVMRAHPSTELSPGDIITAIGGRPADRCLSDQLRLVCNSTERGRIREACERLLCGEPGTTVTATVEGADGVPRVVILRREPAPKFWQEPTLSSRELGGSVGYIRIAQWHGQVSGRGIPEEFDRLLEQFKNLKGIIIDVRGNGGGDDRLADRVNGRLTDKPVVSSIDFWRKAGTTTYERTIGWVRPRGPWTYRGRAAVLIDEASASACEHFVSGIEAMGHILLVGSPTNGAGGGPTSVTLPDGTQLRISRALGLRANGVVFEGHGIPPHIVSTPTLDDLRTGRDAALEIGKEWILSNKTVPSRFQSIDGRLPGREQIPRND
ncbi:MAG TPA: S41 family peptidase [Phycisphaerae bacterium]|nr:S41 family peptidase [Phycisphaerae bacterium]HRY70839.1 S41 family peptidase [Phycisphaerae bacterium]HSA28546.1 S41 family peptidase [Phycisphaerae bacterium]